MKMQVRRQKREKARDQRAISFDFASDWSNRWCGNNNLYSCPEIIQYIQIPVIIKKVGEVD